MVIFSAEAAEDQKFSGPGIPREHSQEVWTSRIRRPNRNCGARASQFRIAEP